MFRGDEWAWLTSALHVTPNSILQDYNGHLLAVTEIFFWLLPTAVGMSHYWVLRLFAVAAHVLVVFLTYRLARRRLGASAALWPAAVVGFLGTGSDVFLSAINIGIVVSVAACLGALVAIETPTPRRDLCACGLLALGLASFSVAVAFAAGIVCELIVRRDWRRLWIVVIPAVLYGVWRSHWGTSVEIGSGRAPHAANVVINAVSAMSASFAGVAGVQLSSPTLRADLPWLGSLAAVVTLIVAAVAAVWMVVKRRLTARVIDLGASAVVLWLLLGFGRGSIGDLAASRYVYLGAVIVVLLIVECMPVAAAPRRGLRLALRALVGLAVGLNLVWLIVWANFLRAQSAGVKGQLTALQLARPQVAEDFIPSSAFVVRALTAGHYFHMISTFGGSPADDLGQLRNASPGDRAQADLVYFRALDLRLRPTSSPHDSPSGSRATRGCLSRNPPAHGASATKLRLPAGRELRLVARSGGLLLVSARLFADRYTPVDGVGTGPRPLTLVLPRNPLSEPWDLQVRASVPLRICSQ